MDEASAEPETAIAQDDLDRSLRRLCRNVAAALIHAMARTDTSFAEIAARTGHLESTLRGFMKRLIDGNARGCSLDMISDFAFAMDGELEMTIAPRVSPSPPNVEREDAPMQDNGGMGR